MRKRLHISGFPFVHIRSREVETNCVWVLTTTVLLAELKYRYFMKRVLIADQNCGMYVPWDTETSTLHKRRHGCVSSTRHVRFLPFLGAITSLLFLQQLNQKQTSILHLIFHRSTVV